MASLEEVLSKLESQARPDQVKGMAAYGMVAEGRLGVAVPDMRKIAKEVGKDHPLALAPDPDRGLACWQTGIPEARIVAAMIAEPAKLTEEQMEAWVLGINSWDVCDQVCMNLFEKSPLAWQKVVDWSESDEEYVNMLARDHSEP